MGTKTYFCINYLAMASIILGLLGCNRPPKTSEDTPVIIISIDTLRSDRLPMYGYSKIKTPALEKFSEDSILYENAFAHVPLTLPSHASLFTGKLPTAHGVRDNIAFLLADTEMTLAEALQAKGYATGAVVSSMVLRREVGLAQGFDFYEDTMEPLPDSAVRTYAQRDGSQSLPLAESWLKENGTRPFFLFFHLYDPHFPYTPPEPFASNYAHPYDGEIAYTDSLLASFFKTLREQGLYDKALIIVTSDHGEGLGDHDEMEHGMFVYREAIQVPLLVKLPNQKSAGTRVEEPVGLIDITPSILASLNTDSWPSDGRVIFGPKSAPANRPIYSESLFAQIHYGWHPQQSVVQDQWHYLRGGGDFLFNYQSDPREKINHFGKQKIPKPMLSLLDQLGQGTTSRAEISEEDLALLSSLGYAGLSSPTEDILALSAKEIVQLKDSFNACHQMIARGEKAEAEAKLQNILSQFPTMMDARILLAVLLRERGDYQTIEHLLAEGLANSPNNLRVLTYLAESKFRLKDLDGAQKLAQKAMAIDAEFAGEVLLPLYLEAGLKEQADKLANQMLSKTDSIQAQYIKSRNALDAGKPEEAAELAKAALAGPVEDSELKVRLLILLGESYLRQTQPNLARPHLEEALSLDPRAKHGRIILNLVLNELGAYETNIEQLKQGLLHSGESVDLWVALTQTQLKAQRPEDAMASADKALQMDAAFASAPLSFTFLTSGDPNQAQLFAQKVLQIQPDAPHAHFVLGWIGHAQKNYLQAYSHLKTAVAGAQEYQDAKLLAEAAFYLGDSAANLQKLREAAEAFQLAIRARPNYPEAQVSLAALYAFSGRQQDASAILDHWLKQFPSAENYQAARELLTKFGLTELAKKITAPELNNSQR